MSLYMVSHKPLMTLNFLNFRVEVFVVRDDGSNHIAQNLDTLEDCTRDTQILPGYWAPRVHCMNVIVVAVYSPVDP